VRILRSIPGALLLLGAASCSRKPDLSAKPDDKVIADVGARVDLSTYVVRDAQWSAYLDLSQLRADGQAPIAEAASTAPPLRGAFARFKRECGEDFLDAAEEVVASGRRGETVVAARIALSPEKAMSCVRQMAAGGADSTIGGHSAYSFDRGAQLSLVANGVFLAGSDALVRELLTEGGRGRPFLRGGEFVAFHRRDDGRVSDVAVSLRSSGEDLVGEALIRTKTSDEASALVAALSRIVQVLTDTRKSLDVSLAHGEGESTVTIRLVQRGTAQRSIGGAGFVSLSFGAASAVLRLDKTGEPQSVVPAIARALAAEADDSKRAGRSPAFTVDVPPLLAAVPAAALALRPSPPAPEWKPYLGLLPPRLFYQYAVAHSADGHHATVTAHGDLDGNGRTSTFAIEVSIDTKGIVAIGPMIVTDRLE
jgi:hypothetical protein